MWSFFNLTIGLYMKCLYLFKQLHIAKWANTHNRWLLVMLQTVFICCYFNSCKDRSVVFKPLTQGKPKGQPNCQGTPLSYWLFFSLTPLDSKVTHAPLLCSHSPTSSRTQCTHVHFFINTQWKLTSKNTVMPKTNITWWQNYKMMKNTHLNEDDKDEGLYYIFKKGL